ncbi:MAG: glycosyltransferase family 4 protein [Planctomycetaceae bacterium]|nr:glycosyltransferase family 4 protein [Planctomycetaceae bacterium]
MRILMCCEFYAPSQGGVQKVIQEVAEHLVRKGHDVTVATSALPERNFTNLNGVKIKEFKASGNLVAGLRGKVNNYQDFILSENFDAVLVKAAQQWTFDALWPIIDKIKARKVHIPCGYSCLYNDNFKEYYQKMPDILKKFDHLIFYAENYRDIDFVKQHGIKNYSILPNGASEVEFRGESSNNFRKQFNIPADDIVFLSVGSPPFMKGHFEVALAYSMLNLPHNSTLILNGNYQSFENPFSNQIDGLVFRLKQKAKDLVKLLLGRSRCNLSMFFKTIKSIQKQKNKRIMILNLPREKVVSAFFHADIFVFASHIEYSPLVLYESSAAGLPFISASVGNAEEIARWTQGGIVYPVKQDGYGYAISDPEQLAMHMTELADDKSKRELLGFNGRKNWEQNYTWEKITDIYEKILAGNQYASNQKII